MDVSWATQYCFQQLPCYLAHARLDCLSRVARRRRVGCVEAPGGRDMGLRVASSGGLLVVHGGCALMMTGRHVGLRGHHGHHAGLLGRHVHGHVLGGDHDDGPAHPVALVGLDAGADEDDEVREAKEKGTGQFSIRIV